MKSTKFQLPDGTVVIQCGTCQRWRHHSAFLVGEKNPKKKECWNSECSYCRESGPFCLETRAVIDMPEDAKWEDVAGPCGCGDGRYHGSGKQGICFRCKGKSEQTWHDRARNYHYDLHEAKKGLQAEIHPDHLVVEDEEDHDYFTQFGGV